MKINSSFIYIYTPFRLSLFLAFPPLPVLAPCALLRTVPEMSAKGFSWCHLIPADGWLRLLPRFPGGPDAGKRGQLACLLVLVFLVELAGLDLLAL